MAQESRLVIVIDAKNAERNARNLGNELDSIERKGDFATKSMDGLSVATRQLAGYMAGLVTVSAAISKMDTYTGLQNRLKLVTSSQVELNKATEDTFRIAQKTYSAWDSVLQVYQRFSDNAKTLNLTMDDTARLTETVSKAVAISGASAAAADAALVQFGQALASGTLRGEELNSVMEQTPALAKAIAQGMGITVGELRTVAAEGKITSQEIVKALRNVEKDVDALFAKTDITIGQSLTLLNNEITKFVGESGKGSGAAQVLAGTIQTLASNLDVLTSAMMVGGAYWLGTYIPAIYASGVAVAAKTKELAVQTVTQYAAIQAERAAAAQQVISTQAAVANTQATLAAIAAEKALEVQRLKSQITEKGRTATLTRMAELKKIEAQVTRELALAEEALAVAQSRSAAAGAASVGIGSRLLGLLGGPVGLGLTVASVAASYIFMSEKTDLTTESIANQIPKVSELTKKYSELNAAQAQSELDKLRSDQKNIQDELTKTSSEMFKFIEITRRLPNISLKNAGEIEGLLNKVYKGSMSASDALIELRKNSEIPESVITKFNNLAVQVDDVRSKSERNIEAQKLAKTRIDQVGNAAQDSVPKFNAQEKAINGVTSALGNANSEYAKYLKQSQEAAISNLYKQGLLEQGYSPSQASAIFDLQQARGMSAILSKEEVESALNVLRITEQTTKAEQAYNDRIKQNSEALKKTANEAKRRREEQERLEKEQTQTRDQVSYEYADDFTRMNIDYQKQVAEINKANFGSEQSKYLEAAKARYDFNAEMYLRQITSEINQHKWSEEEKLKYSLETEKEVIENSGKYNKELKELKLKALGEVTTQELAWLELEKQQRLLDARQLYMSDAEYMQERYRLERDEIAKNMQLSQQERDARIAMSLAEEEFEKRKNLKSASLAWGQSYADMTGSGARFQIEQDRFNRYEESNALFESQIALAETAAEREAIWQAHHERMTAIESAYQQGSYGLQLGYGEQVTGALSNMLGTMLGESSSTYQALFYAQRYFALAQAGMNVWKAASDAYANEPGTWYQKAAAAAIATIKSGKFVSLIQAATPQGFSSGGYTGNMGRGDVAGVVHGQEYVLNAAATKRVGVDTLNAINSGGSLERTVSSSGQPVTIQVYVTDSGVNTNGANTQDQKQLGQMIGNAVRTIIRQEQRQGGMLSK
ncbi:tape measure protein [Acinetobacter junii]|uniref:tape measure protein n=1 Tax=Acinetobacter junii TaxID=40215 RepID=UPI00124FD4E8|nr:tape measure protein [Acinetobacter junii]